MKLTEAERLAAMFREKGDHPENLSAKKAMDVLELFLIRELRGQFPKTEPLKWHDLKEWHGGQNCHRSSCRFYGAGGGEFASPGEVSEINHSGRFLWEVTEFLFCLWCVELLLCVPGGARSVIEAYEGFRAGGFPKVLDLSKSHAKAYFDDPCVWDCFEENSVIDGGYYLYSVLTGTRFPGWLRKRVSEGANLGYLNSFLISLRRNCANDKWKLSLSDKRWLEFDDVLARNAVMMACGVLCAMNEGCSRMSVLTSGEIGKYLGGKRNLLDKRRADVLDSLLETMMEGRGEGDFENGCISEKWPCRVEGILKDGSFISACAAMGDVDFSPWVNHASAAFHALAQTWL